nr:UvrD-helicase domain-containing protein [Leifsonia psychrotolerans]
MRAGRASIDAASPRDASLFTASVGAIGEVAVDRGLFWATVEIPHPDRRIRLRGIPNRRATKLARAIRASALIAEFDAAAENVLQWVTDLETAAVEQLSITGWLTREFTEEWATRKAALGFERLLHEPALQSHAESNARVSAARERWQYELADFIAGQNQHLLSVELEANRDFFETVEKSPLTDEQARAVVCFDNRMLVVASAGSGKTSTMVAKAGYALRRNLIPADNVSNDDEAVDEPAIFRRPGS